MSKTRFIKLIIKFVVILIYVFLSVRLFQYLRLGGDINSEIDLYLESYSGENEDFPLYQISTSSSFSETNSYKNIVAWSDYGFDIPFSIIGNDIIIAGYLLNKSGEMPKTFVDVFKIDLDTGEIKWHKTSADNMLSMDENSIFLSTDNEHFRPSGMTSYDILTGKINWQTFFDLKFAVGNDYFNILPEGLAVQTYHKAESAVYILDPKTGKIKERIPNTLSLQRHPVFEGLTFEKQGDYHYQVGTLSVIRDDGYIVWTFEEPIVSNIAIGGDVTYFFTEDSQLFAVDTFTGDVLDFASFEPKFPKQFDFANNSVIVAAKNNIVSVYFEDARQLSLFEFIP